MKIVWTDKAIHDLEKVQQYLITEWGDFSLHQFSSKLLQTLHLLANSPLIGSKLKEEIRGLVLTSHNTIIYRVKQSEIIILKIFDNRMNPENRTT